MGATEQDDRDTRTRKILSTLGSVAVLCCIALVVALSGYFGQGDGSQAAGDGAGSASEQQPSMADRFESARVVRVVDGDTLIVSRGGEDERLRLIGIDAPESVAEDESRNCGEGRQASDYLKTLVSSGTQLWLEKDVSETDRYGRLLRYAWLEIPEDPWDQEEVAAKMLNGVLVASGYAEAREYRPDTAYAGILDAIGQEAIDQNKGVSYYWG